MRQNSADNRAHLRQPRAITERRHKDHTGGRPAAPCAPPSPGLPAPGISAHAYLSRSACSCFSETKRIPERITHTHTHTHTHPYARTRTHMHTTWSACAFRRLLAAASDSTPSRSFPCSRPPVKASADVPAFVSTSASSISTSWPAASCALGESSRLKSFSRRFCKTGHDTSPLQPSIMRTQHRMVLRVQGVVLPFVVHSVPNRSFAQPSV